MAEAPQTEAPQRLVGMLMFPRMTQLDLTGPYEVLVRLPHTQVHLLARDIAPVRSDRGLAITPTITIAECPQLDVIMVPGRAGQQDLMEDATVLAFLRRQAAGARYVTSVCTGSLVLGAAGLLEGRRATCHWSALESLAALGAIPTAERVVVDGNLVTGAGVAAGIDFALRLAEILEGGTVAREMQLQIEYDPDPPYEGSPATARPETLAVLRARGAKLSEERATVARRVGRKLGLSNASAATTAR